MQINLTLFAQVINFGITYWFLNKFMFKPVLSFLKQKKAKEEKIKKEIEQKEHVLLELEEKKHKEVGSFKDKMKERYKTISPTESKIPSDIIYHVDKNEVKKLIKISEKLLIDRVPHVD